MSLSGFVLFVCGALVEMFILVSANISDLSSPLAGAGWFERVMTPKRLIILILGLIAAGFVGLFELVGIGHLLVYVDTPFISLIVVVLALGLIAASFFAAFVLPVVNEQSILLVQLLVLAGALFNRERISWLPIAALTFAPLGVSLVLIFWRRAFHPSIKAVLYFWYLLSLMVIPFQSGEVALFHQVKLSWIESYSLGMLIVFLLLTGLLAVRFFLIVSALLRLRNHKLVADHLPCLFLDKQVALPRYLLVVMFITMLLAANYYVNLLDSGIAFSLCSLIGVQLLGNDLQPAS